MRRLVGLLLTLVVAMVIGSNVSAQEPSPSSPVGASPSPSPSQAGPSPSAGLAFPVYEPAGTVVDDLGAPGSLRLTLPQFTSRWNSAPGSTKLHGPWKVTKNPNGYSLVEHYWTSTSMQKFGLLGVLDPSKKLVSMSLIYVPHARNGSLDAGLEALQELLLGGALFDAATDLPQDIENAMFDALLTPDLGPQDFLDLDEAVAASGYYLRYGPSDSGDAAYLVVRQANVPLGPVLRQESPSPTSAAPTIPLFSPSPTPAATGIAGDAVSRTGSGSGQSLKFALAAGDYQADWTATDKSDSSLGCYAGINLESDAPDFYGTVVSNTIYHTQSGTNYINNVPEGSEYFIGATTTCDWSVTLTKLP